MSNDWQPLSDRTADRAADPPYDGIPAHLTSPLAAWFAGTCGIFGNSLLGRLGLRLHIAWTSEKALPEYRAVDFLRHALTRGTETFLDVLDATLFLMQEQAAEPGADRAALRDRILQARQLNEILTDGGSLWTVSEHMNALEQRVSTSARGALRAATEAARTHQPSAANHLEAAWSAAYGRDPDPGKAYSEAIKAVEAASAPVVTPKDLKATLGTIRGELRSSAAAFVFAISPGTVESVIAAVSALWDGQTDRHGGTLPTRPITASAASAAVQLAITLVHWFSTGAVRRR